MINNHDLSLLLAYCLCGDYTKGEQVTKPNKEKWLKQIQDIVDWAAGKNYQVKFATDEEDRLCFESKTIFINSRSHPETKYYTLLHEAGHLLISRAWKAFDKAMPMYASSSDGRKERGKAYLVSLVAEEIEAWKRGRRLSSKLGHYIDDEKYDQHITNNVATYITYAADCIEGRS